MSNLPYTEETSPVKNQYLAAITVNILMFCHGCGVGWMSPFLPQLTKEGPDSPLDAPLTPTQAAWVASTVCIGGLLGTPLYGWAADRFGRKTSALMAAVPYTLCWILKLFWRSANGLIIARFAAGLGGAGIFMLAPLYSSEVACRTSRGALGSMMVFATNGGIVFMYILGALVDYTTAQCIMSAVPVIFFILMFRMPETPPYLVKSGRNEEAAKAIAWLRSVPENSSLVQNVLGNLKYEVELANKPSGQQLETIGEKLENPSGIEDIPAWKLLITSRPTYHAFMVSFTLLTIQTFTGMFAVVTYASEIFAGAGSHLSPSSSAIIVGSLQLAGSLIGCLLIEKLGRRILLFVSCLMVSLAMTTMGTYFFVRSSGYDVSTVEWIPIAAISLAVATYGIGIGPVPYVLPPEIFMVQVRGLTTTISLIWLWIASFLLAQFYPASVVAVGADVVYWFFGAVSFGGVIIAAFFLPETKGRPLSEIIAYFAGDKSRMSKKGKPSSENGGLL